ncbi:hypothetical protein ACFQX6_21650 [Streptosporangium lutulentum]
MATALCLVSSAFLNLGHDASAAQTIGYPSFSGPAVPAPPVGYTACNMMQAIYNAESSGTDFWVDRLLGRPGSDPADADGGILMTRGRAFFMKTHTPGTLGFAATPPTSRASPTRARSRWRSRRAPSPSRSASAGRRPAISGACTPAAPSGSSRRSSSPRTTSPWPTCRSPTPGPPPPPCNCGPPRRTPPPAAATS